MIAKYTDGNGTVYEINTTTATILNVNTNQEVSLRPQGIRLLCAMIESRYQFLSFEMICGVLWPDDYSWDGRRQPIKDTICAIRRVLGPESIQSRPGFGYGLVKNRYVIIDGQETEKTILYHFTPDFQDRLIHHLQEHSQLIQELNHYLTR